MFYYENHMGGWYSTDHELSYKETYCEECGDSDFLLGEYESDEDFAKNSSYYDYCSENPTPEEKYQCYLDELKENDKKAKQIEKNANREGIPTKRIDINKYNLTPKNICKLEVNRKLINKENGFWYNNVIKAWCLSCSVGIDEYPVCDNYEYWLGIYDKPNKDKSAKIELTFSCWGGMGTWKFDKFFNFKEIENQDEYGIQYKFIEKMNELIEKGVFIIK